MIVEELLDRKYLLVAHYGKSICKLAMTNTRRQSIWKLSVAHRKTIKNTDMNADEIVAYFVDEVAPVYDSLPSKSKKIFHAILQSLPSTLFEEVVFKLSSERRIPLDLIEYADWMRKEHPGNENKPNEPISTLLRWYQDKESRKVSYAYERLVKRFDAQSFVVQKKILSAFLAGGKNSSEWAARRLRQNWVSGFENKIEMAWKKYKGPAMALTIIYVMPEDFVMKEQGVLVKMANLPEAYAIPCGRLGRTPGFTIDESRLSIFDWFYVVGKLGLSEKVREINSKVNQYILNLNPDDYVGYKNTEGYSLVYILGMDRIIWAMKQLNDVEGIIRLAQLERRVEKRIKGTATNEELISTSVNYLRSLIDDALPNQDNSLYLHY